MPESAISGLVEGLLQGHAIRQQKQRDAEEKNRQHAQDVAAYHIQDWKEKQAAELNKQNAAQQGIDNQLAQDRLGIQKAEEARKVASDANKDKYNQSRVEAAKNLPRERYIDDAYKNSATVDDFNKAMALYDLMHPANQTPAATGGAPVTPALPGAQQAPIIPQVPRGYDTPGNPAFGQQGAAPPPSGTLNPKVAAGIAKTQADTAKAEAMIPKLKADTIYAQEHSNWMKAHVENEKEMKALTIGRTDLVKAQSAYRKAMQEYDGDLKKADKLLADARASEAVARTDYLHEQVTHTKNMDNLKSSSLDLNTEGKKANLREKAMKEEGSFRKDKEKQEDALGKMQFSLNAQSRIASMDKSKIDATDPKNTAILVQIDTAKANVPYLQQRIAETKDRIDNYTKREAEAHAYVAQTTDMLNKSGTVDKKATEKNRAAADKAAKNPPSIPALNPDFPFVQPTRGRTAPPGAHPKVQAVAPGKTSGNQKTGKLKTMTDAELDALRKKLEHHQ